MAKILLIDDDPHLRSILTTILAKNDFEIIVEQDGASGLSKARALHPDLIILDIIMPGMDGFEVAHRLHADPNCAQIPILVLTALGTPYARDRAARAGVAAFVTKPFSIDDIVARAKSMTATAGGASSDS